MQKIWAKIGQIQRFWNAFRKANGRQFFLVPMLKRNIVQVFDFQEVRGKEAQRMYIDGRWEESLDLLSNKIGFN